MKNHGFSESQWEDMPKAVESDDERMDTLMDLQDPYGLDEYGPEKPKSIEEKYEAEITMEKVIQPMLNDIFGNSKNPEEPDAE